MLSAKQEQMVLILLDAPDRKSAAARAGVHEQTLYRWLRTDDFRAALNEARRRLREKRIDLIAERQLAMK